jgi:hypothetical protein
MILPAIHAGDERFMLRVRKPACLLLVYGKIPLAISADRNSTLRASLIART